jgi:hypothetical protein
MQAAARAFAQKIDKNGRCHVAGEKFAKADVCKGVAAASAAAAHAGKSERRVVSAFIGTAFAQNDAGEAKAQWRRVADQLRPKLPRLRLACGLRKVVLQPR